MIHKNLRVILLNDQNDDIFEAGKEDTLIGPSLIDHRINNSITQKTALPVTQNFDYFHLVAGEISI